MAYTFYLFVALLEIVKTILFDLFRKKWYSKLSWIGNQMYAGSVVKVVHVNLEYDMIYLKCYPTLFHQSQNESS